MSANTYPDTNIPDVSRWRSSSSERTAEDGTNNTTNEDEYNSKKKPELSYDPAETLEKRLERLKKFYSEKPRECYLDKDDNKEYLGNLLFDRLYHEVQYTVFETGPSKHRGQEHVRFFWDDVRRQLRDDEEPALEWPPAKEVQHCMASIHDGNSVRDVRPCEEQQSPVKDNFLTSRKGSRGPSSRPNSPTVKRTATGENLELLEIREYLMNRPRQNRQR